MLVAVQALVEGLAPGRGRHDAVAAGKGPMLANNQHGESTLLPQGPENCWKVARQRQVKSPAFRLHRGQLRCVEAFGFKFKPGLSKFRKSLNFVFEG